MSALRTEGLVPPALVLCSVVALLVPTLAGITQTRRFSALLARSEASELVERTHRVIQESPPPPSARDFQQVFDEHAARGLRYVGVVEPDGRLRGHGDITLDRPPPCDRDALRVTPRDDMVLACSPPLPPPRGLPPGVRVPIEMRPRIVVAFTPREDRALVGAQRIQLVATLVTLLAALGLWMSARRFLRGREELARRLVQAEHLSALGELSAVLAHEIRNPLAALKGHAQLMAESLVGHPKHGTRGKRVVNEALRLERLVNDLLAFGRTGVLALASVDPTALVREVLRVAEVDAVELNDSAAPERWTLDPARMAEALENIVRNALDAQGEGHELHLTVALEDDQLVIAVRDHGPGITPGEEEAIFEPFRTGKVRGTGLGLAVARRTVGLHGGTITARNHPEGGAVFRVVIPRGRVDDKGSHRRR